MIKFLKKLYYKWRVKNAMKTLQMIDDLMKKAGYKRYERRQFWRDFIKARKEVLKDLIK